MRNSKFTFFLACCFLATTSLAQPAYNNSSSTLSIEKIMQGEKFVGVSPNGAFWSEDSKTVYFNWNPDMDTLPSLYKVILPNGKPQKVSFEEENQLPGRGTYNKDRTKKLYNKNGDVFLLDLKSNTTKQITNTVDWESNPQFAADENKITYTRSRNLYVWDAQDGSTTQLTNFQKGRARPEPRLNEMQEWLNNDQLAYFEIIRQRKEVDEVEEKMDERFDPQRPMEIYYGDHRISQIQASPDLKFVTYRITKSSKAKEDNRLQRS